MVLRHLSHLWYINYIIEISEKEKILRKILSRIIVGIEMATGEYVNSKKLFE